VMVKGPVINTEPQASIICCDKKSAQSSRLMLIDGCSLIEEPPCHFTWVGKVVRSLCRALAHQIRDQLHNPMVYVVVIVRLIGGRRYCVSGHIMMGFPKTLCSWKQPGKHCEPHFRTSPVDQEITGE